MLHVHTDDLELALQTVRDIYCPHQLFFSSSTRRIETKVDVSGPEAWPLVRLRYGAPVEVDAGNFPDLFLVMKCVDGFGSMSQREAHSAWQPGRIVPMSPNLATSFKFSETFSQITFKPSKQRLEELCGRWLGHPVDHDLRFALQPFSPALERAWSHALALIESHGGAGLELPVAAESALEEYVLTLLLHGHPHNYSQELSKPGQKPQSRIVRRAERYIAENAGQPITVSSVAAAVGTSVRALQAKFRQERNVTPLEHLREVRLQQVHQALCQATESATVTTVALAHGFAHLGRFSEIYRTRFGESPLLTLRRSRRSTDRCEP